MPIRTDPTARPVTAGGVPGPAASQESAALPERPLRPVAPREPAASSVLAAPRVSAGRPAARPAPRRPDPTITRLAVAAGGIATISALLAAIAGAAVPAATAAAAPTTGPVQTIVKYVYVQPGQVNPGTGLATVVAPPAPLQAPAPVVTRQSGAKP